jgi:hypothetical protein
LILGKKHRLGSGTLDLPPIKGASPRRAKMEMFRNMEVVLVFCFGLIVAAALVSRPTPTEESVRARGNTAAQMPVVVINGKRLSEAEKAQAAREAG